MNFSRLLQTSRPRFWIYVFGPFLVGAVAGAHKPQDLLIWRLWLWGVFFTLPANLLIYGVNDIFDYETDRRNAKKTGYERLVLPDARPALWRTISLFCGPFVLLLPFTNPLPILALGFFLFFSLFYSAPPIRAKARPILDSIFNVLYIFPGVLSFFLVAGQNFSLALFGSAWLWAMAMHAYSAVPDISADRESGLATIATLFQARGTLLFCLALYLSSAAIAFPVLHWLALILGTIYAVLMLLSLRAKNEMGVLEIYRFFPVVNTLAGMAMTIWILIHKNWT